MVPDVISTGECDESERPRRSTSVVPGIARTGQVLAGRARARSGMSRSGSANDTRRGLICVMVTSPSPWFAVTTMLPGDRTPAERARWVPVMVV